MKGKNIFKIGLVIILVFAFSGISYIPSAEEPLPNTEYWALIFSPWTQPPSNWAGDCDLLFRVLTSYGWENDNIIRLKENEATINNLINELGYLTSQVTDNDFVSICLLTHGNNTYRHKFDDKYDTPMHYSDLDILLDNIDYKGMGIIMDTCFSYNCIQYLEDVDRVIATSDDSGDYALGKFCRIMTLGFDEFGDYCNNNEPDDIVTFEEAYDYAVFNGYPSSAFSDNYEGELPITSLNWEDGYIDQITKYTASHEIEGYTLKVQTYEDGDRYFKVAQSFQPDLPWLTKVRLHCVWDNKLNPPEGNLNVSIREPKNEGEGPKDEYLISVEINPLNWIEEYITCEFNYPLTPDEKYYIVCRMDGFDEDQYYIIYYHDEHYPPGSCWTRNEGTGWEQVEPFADIDFVTYGWDNHAPSAPEINGETNGESELNYPYTFVSIDPEDEDVFYYIDWGDGNVEEWIGSFPSGSIQTVYHTYYDQGTYLIKAKAKDTFGLESFWSTLTVRIDNQAPIKPDINGPTEGQGEEELDYTFKSTDPENDNVKYYIDWADGNTEETNFNPSGVEVEVSHSWAEPGTYIIKAKAIDIYDAESDWGELEVEIPRCKNHGVPQGTQITMAPYVPGSPKPVEAVQLGDHILSYNPTLQELTVAEVIEVYEYTGIPPDNRFIFNDILENTFANTMYINQMEWLLANDTVLFDCMLQNIPGSPFTTQVPIISKVRSTGPVTTVYDLVIRPISGEAVGYWANGILVGGWD